ncbi:hypothetical protein N665_0714s0033 [Sinapis alba]|nr:hypothetical protein N665_0714s0033 [Sinapis alba]
MGSSIKINSISIDLAGAANEIDMVKCDHFSMRGYVAERRERDHRKCWPFSDESVSLGNQQSYPLPSLSVPKSRWWRCMSCIRDIDADGTKDLGLHANSTSISGEKQDGVSSVIPSQRKVNLLTVTDQEKERNDIAGNAVVENEDVNCERSQTVAVTTLVKKVHPPAKDTIRNKIRKLASGQQVGNKRSKVSKSSTDTSSWKEKQNVNQATTFASSDIAGVVEDTPPKAIKNHRDDKVSSESINLGFQRRKTRKVRLLSELIVDPETKASSNNIRQEESSSSKARGRKRKVTPENNYVSRKLSTAGATSDQGDSESTDDSGFGRDLIKGKKKNRRFQVVDEFVPSLPSQERGHDENDAGPSKSALSKEQDSVPHQRTEKKVRKKKNKPVIMDNEKGSLISFSSGPSINASSQSTQNLLNEKRVGSSLDDRLAAEGYFRKPIPPQVNNDRHVASLHMQDNAHVRPTDAEANYLQEFGSSSRPNTGGWLRTGVDTVDFSLNNNTDKGFADLSSALQKDASSADRKGKTVMVQEHQGAKSHDRKENTPEEQNDDITLEIAELMAKNQYERCLPDKEEDISNKQPPQEETAHRSKNALLIDLNETYDNETSLEDNNNTSRPQQKPLDFFPLRQPYVPSPFGIFPPTQENRPNSIRFSGHNNCQWLGNVPTMANQHPSPSSYRVLRGCNTCYQSVPHQYREAAPSHPSWPPSMVRPQCHPTPVSFNMDQSTRLGPSNNNTWNLNFVAPNGKQTCGSNPNRSVDAYSNESSIPALNLLSLMDPRLRSNAPAEHHGNTNFIRRHFPPVNQAKERAGLETGDSSKTAYPTKQSPFNFYSNGFAPEASRKSFPIGPPLGTSSFSFQSAQAPWSHHHHQEKMTKSKDTVPQVFPSSNDQGRFQILRGSNSMKLPFKEMSQKRKAEGSSNASVLPPKNSSGSFVCSVNRNPADFTVPGPGNVYMLTSENLKVRKRAPYKTKASLCKEDAMKQTKKTVGPVTENA